MSLKTDYKDDIPKTAQRRYELINNNDDGTVSLKDATDYTQVGDNFGAGDINKTNNEVNNLKNATHDTGWVNASLVTGVNSATGQNVQYRKVGKVVYLRGVLSRGFASGRVITTLPIGYRPNITHHTITPANGQYLARWRVETDGRVILDHIAVGASQWYGGDFCSVAMTFLVE